MRSKRIVLLLLAMTGAVVAASVSEPTGRMLPREGEVNDVLLRWTTTDGTPMEGKLSVPASARGRVPVVFYLHGAGPRTYDHPVRYRDADGQIKSTKYYDYYARELAREGMAFFRVSKRGVTSDSTGRMVVDRAIFARATPTVLLDDYVQALKLLRARSEIDATRIVLYGASEGTRLAPVLANRAPDGIVGLVLSSFQSDNTHRTVVWQNTVGPWRGVVKLVPAAVGGALTKADYDAALKANPALGSRLPFSAIDADSNAVVTEAELIRLVKPRLEAILKAVEDRNDDLLWQAMLNLTSAYLLDDWDGEPTSSCLLKVTVPIAIFHGELDNVTRVEGVRETAVAFVAAGKRNLTVRVYPGLDHDLGWTAATAAASGDGPQAYQDTFRQAAAFARRR